MCQFRLLNADEIECRIGTMKKAKDAKGNEVVAGVSLLLYKDARVDMTLLDEVVGPMNWQRTHEVIDGKLCCTVSIWDEEKKMWIDKQDVGTESNTEATKGLFSDSFKRSCVCVGIGRELYSAPFIWVNANQGENIKFTKFDVKSITYDEKRRIASLVIVDDKGNTRFTWPKATAQPQPAPQPLSDQKRDYITTALRNCKTREDFIAVAKQYQSEIQSDANLTATYKEVGAKFQKQ